MNKKILLLLFSLCFSITFCVACNNKTSGVTTSNTILETRQQENVIGKLIIPTEEEIVIESMNVWQMGYEFYGISPEDTDRTLKLITYEGYGESPLSYYVACCCWTRATENYWGYGNLYQAFGEADTSYDLWMDSLGIADYAYDALFECYQNPMYIRYCNGMAIPSEYIYYENGIYVWN